MKETFARVLTILVLVGFGIVLGLILSKNNRTDYLIMLIATHDGISPHADEIFAIAILKIVYPQCEVIRTRKVKQMKEADIRVDVGMKYNPPLDFDHHQPDFKLIRKDGRPYASAGLVAQHFWKELVGKDNRDVFNRVDEVLFSFIDAVDCGVETYKHIDPYRVFGLHHILGQFAPHYSEVKNLRKTEQRKVSDAGFLRAVAFAKDLIVHEIEQARLWIKDQDTVKRAISTAQRKDPRLIILNRPCNWGKVVSMLAPQALFVISHDEIARTWSLQTVPRAGEQFSSKKLLPASWAGKRGKDLVEVTGISDAVFCHSARFLAVAKTKEGILEMADRVMD